MLLREPSDLKNTLKLGETAFVQLGKEGPIYHVEWAPKMAQFCVVYGFMPAKATLYNKKCEKVFDFGTGPRNLALFNCQGSLLMLGKSYFFPEA